MKERAVFYRGVMTGMLALMAADAVHWFITPAAHPTASAARSIAVGIQAVLCVVGALWFARPTKSVATAANP